MKALIICAAPEIDINYLTGLAQNADKIICADGGLKYALECSLVPDIVIGDMDSFTGTIPDLPLIKLDTHKDDTDTLCCVKKALELGCDQITMACAAGGRTDHTIANISLLLYIANKGAYGEIVTSKEKIYLLTEGRRIFKNERGKTFSLFALENCVVSYENAEYPLERKKLNAAYPLGISNKFTQDFAAITVHEGKAILIITLPNMPDVS